MSRPPDCPVTVTTTMVTTTPATSITSTSTNLTVSVAVSAAESATNAATAATNAAVAAAANVTDSTAESVAAAAAAADAAEAAEAAAVDAVAAANAAVEAAAANTATSIETAVASTIAATTVATNSTTVATTAASTLTTTTTTTTNTTTNSSTGPTGSVTSVATGPPPQPPEPPDPPCIQCGCNGETHTETTILIGTNGETINTSGGDEVCRGIITHEDNTFTCVGHAVGSLFETTEGGEDIIAFRSDFSGNLVWSLQFGQTTRNATTGAISSNGNDLCLSIATDSNGNIYCGGKTTSGLAVGGNLGGYDAFVMKINTSGEILWVSQFGGSLDEQCNSITVDSNDNVYCTGETFSDFVEDNGSFPNNDNSDIFVIKISSAGLVQWKRQFGENSELISQIDNSDSSQLGRGIAMANDGNIIIGGSSVGTFINTGSGGVGQEDALLLKLNSSNGNVIWGKQFGGIYNDRCNSVAVDSNGYIYCGGFSDGSFGRLTPESTSTGTNGMIFKTTSDGVFLWGRVIGNTAGTHSASNSTCLDMEIDAYDNVYCAGVITATATTGIAQNKIQSLLGDFLLNEAFADEVSSYVSDTFITKFDSDGGTFIQKFL